MKPVCTLTVLMAAVCALATPAGQYRLRLTPQMLTPSAAHADFSGLVDEQLDVGDPPSGEPTNGWKINSQHNKEFPFSVQVDLGQTTPLSKLWIFDTNSSGDLKIEAGTPAQWAEAAVYDCGVYKHWKSIELDLETRYLRLTLMTPGAIFTELALDAYSPAGWDAIQAKKAEADRREAERAAALKKAREEALKRPLVELPPYGTLSLVDEVDLGADEPGHMLRVDDGNPPLVKTILGRRCRVLPKTTGESTYMTMRLGSQKLLRAHGVYIVAVDYPEDAPRSMVVINTGNETSRGFHTGRALGDALHAKYVNNMVESLDVPLSGKWETWSLLCRLHDRFPEGGLVRGKRRPRSLTPEDGFDVTICQFSAKNIPMSQGAAVSRVRLFEVVDPDKLAVPLNLPPEDLPRRHIFWREEMADGVIGGKKPEERGLDNFLDWYRNKAELMRFLGINTYTKDLLEFGACQAWDPREYGGHDWVYFGNEIKHWWSEIVPMMGEYGFDVLPYYEYSGSKGRHGLGNQRRAKPLTRDDAYTHISWVEKANADITDPDTIEDFEKMVDLTVLRHMDKANFLGVWIRTRSQLPVGFGPATLKRFATEANGGKAVTRDAIKNNEALYDRYLAWWGTKRRDFFTAIRDHMREKGLEDALVLYSGCPSEPGQGFGDWNPRFVTDRPDLWKPILAKDVHKPGNDRVRRILTPKEVVDEDLYLKGLTSPGLNWGDWEVHHARPADDPLTYKNVDGVMLAHAFNRLYTVLSPKTLDLFRSPAGLTIVRHYTLNENMMFDANDQSKLGYFVVDVERAGPFCMQGEAVAMANGNPTMIGYLVGSNFGRGFPEYVRNFNANFLALPALPSKRLANVSSDPDVVVRGIRTETHGDYFAVVNTTMVPRRVTLALPVEVTALDGRTTLGKAGGKLTLDLYPYQLVSLHRK